MKRWTLIRCVAAAIAVPASGQMPTPAPAAAPTYAVPDPHYVTVVLEEDVQRSAAETWRRVGKFCDIGQWLGTGCRLTAGDDWTLGSVRVLGNGVVEMLVGRTALSYTYTQPVRRDVPFNAYHGTLEVLPVTATSSRLHYAFFYDNSMLPDDKARQDELARRRARFGDAMKAMKALAEGRALPPVR